MRAETQDPDRDSWDAFASIYDEESISPFRRGVRFPLVKDVAEHVRQWRKDKSLSSRVGIDFGCGPGDAMHALHERVGLAIGLDFSPAMLRVCARRLGLPRAGKDAAALIDAREQSRSAGKEPSKETRVALGDLRDLSALHGRVDVAVSVNAICPPESRYAITMLREILRTLKRGGRAFVVVPAAEATAQLFGQARQARYDLSELATYDARRAVLTYPNGEQQRYLREREMRTAAKVCKVRVERLERLEYPWTHMREAGWGYFPKEPRQFDWYLVARRP